MLRKKVIKFIEVYRRGKIDPCIKIVFYYFNIEQDIHKSVSYEFLKRGHNSSTAIFYTKILRTTFNLKCIQDVPQRLTSTSGKLEAPNSNSLMEKSNNLT